MKKTVIYSISVCLFSWAVIELAYALISQTTFLGRMLMQLISLMYMFLPMAVALVMQWIRKEKPAGTKLLNFNFSPVWLVAIAVPFAVLLLSLLFSIMVPGARLHYGPENIIAFQGLEGEAADTVTAQFSSMSPAMMIISTLIGGVFAGCTINAVAAFGEEYGWRNYMVDALRGEKFWKTALIIGLVWGIWHAPLILRGHNYPQHPVAGVAMMCVFCLLFGALELYFVLKTKSVIPAALMHGTLNAIAGASLMLIQGGNDLTVGMTGACGFAAIAIVLSAVWFYDSRHDKIMAGAVQSA